MTMQNSPYLDKPLLSERERAAVDRLKAAGYRTSFAAVTGDEWNWRAPNFDPQQRKPGTYKAGFATEKDAWLDLLRELDR